MIAPQPSPAHRFAAQVLRSTAGDIARDAAIILADQFPAVAARYQPGPIDHWTPALTARIGELADAIGAGRAELLEAQIDWSRAAFVARGVPIDDLRAGLLSLARAVPHHLPEDDHPLIEDFLKRALARTEISDGSAPERLTLSSPLAAKGAAYLLAILEGDRRRACELVVDATRDGLCLSRLYREVLTPVMHEVGRMWHLAEISVAEEHFATATTLTAMSQALALAHREPPNGRTLVAAAVEGNGHEIGARMVADIFEVAGWRSIYLGPNIPGEDLILATQDFKADTAALSVSLLSQVAVLADTLAAMRDRLGAAMPRTIVGGLALDTASDLWLQCGADAYARGPEEALAFARSPRA